MNLQETQEVFTDLMKAFPDVFEDEKEEFTRIMGKCFVRSVMNELVTETTRHPSLSTEEAEKWRERSQRLSDKVARFDPNWDGRRILYPEPDCKPVQTTCYGRPNSGDHITAGSPEWAV